MIEKVSYRKDRRSVPLSRIMQNYLNFISNIILDNSDIVKDKSEQNSYLYFVSIRLPSISLESYVEYLLCSGIVIIENIDGLCVHSLIFLQRLLKCDIRFDLYTCHRFVLTSLLLASKIYEDDYCVNLYWAKIGGVSLSNLNHMELEFVKFVSFNLFVSKELFLSLIKCLL